MPIPFLNSPNGFFVKKLHPNPVFPVFPARVAANGLLGVSAPLDCGLPQGTKLAIVRAMEVPPATSAEEHRKYFSGKMFSPGR